MLLIPGGAADAGSFARMGPLLREHFTVVAYDPRGTARSPHLGAPSDIQVGTHADDACLLLMSLDARPAIVFGTSAGAVTGLELVVRHPERVRCLVAHEPPITELLPDPAAHRARTADLIALYRERGVDAALARFLDVTEIGAGLDTNTMWPPVSSDPDEVAANTRFRSNLDVFFGHVIGPLGLYRPDLAVLSRTPTRIVVAAGTESAGQLPHRAAAALATALATPLVQVPGDHRGYLGQAESFVTALRSLSQNLQAPGCARQHAAPLTERNSATGELFM